MGSARLLGKTFASMLAASLAVTAAVAGAVVGCSSTSSSGTRDGGNDTATDGTSSDVEVDVSVVDAGPDVQQDPNVYPAKHHPIPQVPDLGGPVLKNPHVVTVTFNYVVVDAGVHDSGTPDTAVSDDSGLDATTGEGGPTEAGPVDSGVPVDAGSDGGPPAGSDPFADYLEAFGDKITTTPWWTAALGAYGVGPGTGGVHIRLPDALPGTPGQTISNSSLSDDQIQQLIQAEVMAGVFPQPTDDTIYVIYFPASTIINSLGGISCMQFEGYHGAAGSVPTADGTPAAYAVIPRCPQFAAGDVGLEELTTETASHEIAEASSDPQTDTDPAYYLFTNDAWVFYGQGSGGEIGDLCAGIDVSAYSANGFTVQRIWSNSAAAASHDPCEPTDDLMQIYYNAAVETQTIVDSMGQKSDGYVVVPRGTTQNFTVDVFSAAALPSELSFYVGVPVQMASDPTQLSPIATGVTAALSMTSGHNGSVATLAITASNSSALGDTYFVVRSVLSPTDYHDWPVILHVK